MGVGLENRRSSEPSRLTVISPSYALVLTHVHEETAAHPHRLVHVSPVGGFWARSPPSLSRSHSWYICSPNSTRYLYPFYISFRVDPFPHNVTDRAALSLDILPLCVGQVHFWTIPIGSHLYKRGLYSLRRHHLYRFRMFCQVWCEYVTIGRNHVFCDSDPSNTRSQKPCRTGTGKVFEPCLN